MVSSLYSPFRIRILNPEPRPAFKPPKPRRFSVRSDFHTSPELTGRLHLSRSVQIQTDLAGEAVVGPSVAFVTQPKRARKNVLLFYCEEMEELAKQVVRESDSIELRSISWRKFEDGFPNLFISNAHAIRGQHVAFLASFSSPHVIFEQLSIIYSLPRLFVSSFTLVLPFFPTGSYERMEDEGDVATAFTLARILSNVPISRGGPTSVVIFDIHALQERFYFGDYVLPCFESGVPLLKNRLQQLPDSDNISIAFPDDGAYKRFHKQLQHFPVIVCNKVREGEKRFVRIKEGDPKGRHIVIVDDLVQSGGTLIECQKVLAAHGAAKISAYVTHGIFPNESWQRFQYDNGVGPQNGLTHFWITDSCPLTVKEPEEGTQQMEIDGCDPMQVDGPEEDFMDWEPSPPEHIRSPSSFGRLPLPSGQPCFPGWTPPPSGQPCFTIWTPVPPPPHQQPRFVGWQPPPWDQPHFVAWVPPPDPPYDMSRSVVIMVR